MKDLVQKLIQSFRSSTPGARVGMVVSTLAMLGLIGFTTFTATRPNFVPLVSGLNETQRAACTNALAQGGVSYRVSPLPGPFTLEVDERDTYSAQGLIDAAGLSFVGMAVVLHYSPVGIRDRIRAWFAEAPAFAVAVAVVLIGGLCSLFAENADEFYYFQF